MNGWKVETKDPTGTLYEPTDPVTGGKLPGRLLMPDYGWDFNPAKSVLGGLTPKPARGFTDIGQKTFTDYGRRKLANLPAKAYRSFSNSDLLPLGLPEQTYLDSFVGEFGFDKAGGGVFTDKLKEPLIISKDLFMAGNGSIKVTKRGREAYLKLLADTIKNPYEIWLVPMKENRTERIVLRKRYVRAFSDGPDKKLAGLAVFDYGAGGWEGVTAFTPDTLKYADAMRNGVLLYKQ